MNYTELNSQQKNNYWKIIQQFNDLYPDGTSIMDSKVSETIRYLIARLPLEYTWCGGWYPRVNLHEKSTGTHLTLIWYQKHKDIDIDVRCLFVSIDAKSPYLTLTYYDNYTKQMSYVKGHEVELYMDMNLETMDRAPKKIIDILSDSNFIFCDSESYIKGINNKINKYKEIEKENKEKEHFKDKKEERISWNDYFMEMCDLVAKRSTCLRRKIGAVIVKDNQVLATGYNGAPSGTIHCSDIEGGCMRERLGIESGTHHELCVAGNTQIKLLDGTIKTIEELNDTVHLLDHVDVYSYNKEKGITFGKGCLFKYSGYRECVNITLDNGFVVTCTPDHKFLLTSGEFVEAQNLDYGSSLMSMYYSYHDNNGKYEFIYGDTNTGELTHHKVARHKLYFEPEEGKIIHHKNFNSLDNRPSNLEQLTVSEHRCLHNAFEPKTSEFYREIGKKGIEAKRLIGWSEEERKAISERTKNQWKTNTEFREKTLAILRQNCVKGALKSNRDPKAIRSRRIGNIRSGISRLLFLAKTKLNIDITAENYNSIRAKFNTRRNEKGPCPPKMENILKYYKTFEEALSDAKRYNHKVVSVTPAGLHHVYDMTVLFDENFAIYVGDNSCIFAHNCRASHSEQSAIAQAAKHGVSIDGATLYCNTRPCSICTRLIINSGIKKVYYRDYYPDEFSDKLFKEAGIELVKIN